MKCYVSNMAGILKPGCMPLETKVFCFDMGADVMS